jgi:hypothetical protein
MLFLQHFVIAYMQSTYCSPGETERESATRCTSETFALRSGRFSKKLLQGVENLGRSAAE